MSKHIKDNPLEALSTFSMPLDDHPTVSSLAHGLSFIGAGTGSTHPTNIAKCMYLV